MFFFVPGAWATVFLLPDLNYFSAMFFFLGYWCNTVTWLTFAFWFVSRAAGNSLFTAGVCLPCLHSPAHVRFLSLSLPAATLQLFMALVVYGSSLSKKWKTPSCWLCCSRFLSFFFSDLPFLFTSFPMDCFGFICHKTSCPNTHKKEKSNIQHEI